MVYWRKTFYQKGVSRSFLCRTHVNLSFSLPKYNSAIVKLVGEVKKGFLELDPILGQIRTISVSHGGATRQVSEPKIVDTEMNKFSVDTVFELDCFRKTDVEEFRNLLWKFSESAIAQMKTHFFEVVNQTVEAVGNDVDANGRNFWESYPEVINKIQMAFDENGLPDHQIVVHPNMAKKLKENPPTPEQIQRIEEAIKAKREEYYAQKRTRRLS